MQAAQVVKPPIRKQNPSGKVGVFLAGSIEMGKAVDWQYSLGESLTYFHEVGNIYNPRRDDWDSSWVQRKDNPQFSEQVNWELDHIEEADIVFFNFIEETMSPITLLELGFCLGSMQDVIVCCPPGFWRKGNVDIICDREMTQVYDNYTDAIAALYKKVRQVYEEYKQV